MTLAFEEVPSASPGILLEKGGERTATRHQAVSTRTVTIPGHHAFNISQSTLLIKFPFHFPK